MKATLILSAISLFTASAAAATCSALYGQCGGTGWTGPTCCPSGSTCVTQAGNAYYSQCLPGSSSSTSSSKTTTTKSTSTSSSKTTTSSSSSSPTLVPISGGSSGSGTTTRYWDCCKPSCGWTGKGSVTAPVNTCAANGVSIVSSSTTSGCNGGTAYMCNNQQPWAINDNLAYGFAAATIAGLTEQNWCCTCYALKFTSGSVAGKTLVVQITNTGGDLGSNQFDLQLPGGGVGLFNGCSTQWGAPSTGWGAQYGGVSSLSDCSSLPSQLQAGCQFRFGWFKNADNPSVSFQQVQCPTQLTSITGCARTG